MLISRLELNGYRNYTNLTVQPSEGLTILVGPNATGKTNVIEAIQILATGHSFRNPKWPEVVRWGTQNARLSLTANEDGAPFEIELDITVGGVKTLTVNGIKKRRHSEVSGRLPCVIFTPDDLALAKGPAENRRAAIDNLGEQLSKTYGSIKRDYLKTVRQRNAFLKEGRQDQTTLGAFDDQLIRLGSSLVSHRRRLLQRVAVPACDLYGELAASEPLDIEYESHLLKGVSLEAKIEPADIALRFMKELHSRRTDELVRQTTLVGPHRDDIVFKIQGKDARAFASQGQQRTIALAWKWAEVRVIEEISHRKPVLLLDDVMSELDSSRRTALTALMQDGIQTFVTTTNTGYFDPALLTSAQIVEIPGG